MTSVVALLMAPAIIYLVWRYNVASKHLFTGKNRVGFILTVIFCSFYLFPASAVLSFFLSGGIDVLKFPKPLTYWFWFGLVFVYVLASWVIIADVVKIVSHFVSDKVALINGIYAKGLFLILGITFCFTAWKTYDNTTQVLTKQIALPVKGLPDRLDGFKIVHISDIQGDEYTGRSEIAGYIKKVNHLNPDVIIFTGDLISYGTDYIGMSAEEFGKAKSTYGSIAVVGDHDYWAGVENVKEALNHQGIPVIQDSNYSIALDSADTMLITGVTEVYSKKVDPGVVDSLTQYSDDSAIKIFASHQIAGHLIEDAQKHNYDAMLAGHTHGGQVRVPFMGMTFSASDLETSFISGVYHKGDILINVNNGLGFTLAPIRYNAPPNISVITLHPK